ncbi:MAG: DNA translocase FtsK [Actinomycetia bacterium]|nr:DNA translocase FtsK [Actinomycetes bacterium]
MATRTKSRGAAGRSKATPKKTKRISLRARTVQALRTSRDRIRARFARQSDDLWGIVLMVLAALVGLSFFGLSGPIGAGLSGSLRFLFGMWAFGVPIVLVIIGLSLVGVCCSEDRGRLVAGLAAIFVASLALFHLLTGSVALAGHVDQVKESGGAVGAIVAFPLRRTIGFWGALLVLMGALGVGTLIVTKASVKDVAGTLGSFSRSFRSWIGFGDDDGSSTKISRKNGPIEIQEQAPDPSTTRPENGLKKSAKDPKKAKPKRAPAPQAVSVDGYQLPSLDLLEASASEGPNRGGLEQTAAELQEALSQHGVDARLTRIVPGPTVTRYEIELAPGVKVSRVTSLSHDIAYALASPDVRILAPIPGKSAIGIEVPNRNRQMVTLGDILRSEAAEDSDPMLVAIGKDVSGKAHMMRLTELPHVLIAGATGAGKSSCINALLTSILMRARPDEVRLILVDPKRVELGQYDNVPHLLTRVITNPKKAADALQWAVAEMDRRYDLLADSGVRDVESYYEKYDAGGIDEELFDRFPYIVLVVDELNDLMMVAGRSVEDSIVRIAQMARAVGIHLVLATQRPSVNVITGVIKANVPSRLAFSVTSQTDSRVIIDQVGAEKLVGLGDMLVVTAREPKPERIQGAWVSEAEVRRVVSAVREQQKTKYKDTEVFEAAKKATEVNEEFEGEDPEIMRQAIELVVRSQLGSTSMLQRKLRIGFARAGRVMDILENKGIVGPSEGSKARSVLVTEEELGSLIG